MALDTIAEFSAGQKTGVPRAVEIRRSESVPPHPFVAQFDGGTQISSHAPGFANEQGVQGASGVLPLPALAAEASPCASDQTRLAIGDGEVQRLKRLVKVPETFRAGFAEGGLEGAERVDSIKPGSRIQGRTSWAGGFSRASGGLRIDSSPLGLRK